MLALYWSLPRRGQNLLLIFASYIFYGWEHPWFLLPLWASTVVDYSCALGMERFPRRRRVFLVISIAASIALLATFKYYEFALENMNAILANFGQDPLRNTSPTRPPGRDSRSTLFNRSATSSMFTADASKPCGSCPITRSM